jgi:HlyD family secretion protein
MSGVAFQRSILVRGGAVLAIGLAVGAVLAFGGQSIPPVLEPSTNVPVIVRGIGTIEADRMASVGFEVPGVVAKLAVDVNKTIAQGDVLATLDDTRQQAQLAVTRTTIAASESEIRQMEALIRSAAAEVDLRRRAAERNESLAKRGVVATSVAEDAVSALDAAVATHVSSQRAYDVAVAKLQQARATADLEQVMLDKHILRSPFDALVTAKMHEMGDVLMAGTPIFTLLDMNSIWVLAYVDEARSGEIRVGQPAEIMLRSRGGQRFAGHVARINMENDRTTEERRVYVRFDVIPPDINLGEQAEVAITIATLPQALLLPEYLITPVDGHTGLAWTVKDGRPEQRRVTLGRRLDDGRVEIVEPLPDGASLLSGPPVNRSLAVLGLGSDP